MCDNRKESAPSFPIIGAEAGLLQVTCDAGISLGKGYSLGPLKYFHVSSGLKVTGNHLLWF